MRHKVSNEMNQIEKYRLIYQEAKKSHELIVERIDFISETCLKMITIIASFIGLITFIILQDWIDILSEKVFTRATFGIFYFLISLSLLSFFLGYIPQKKEMIHDPDQLFSGINLSQSEILKKLIGGYTNFVSTNIKIREEVSKRMRSGFNLLYISLLWFYSALSYRMINVPDYRVFIFTTITVIVIFLLSISPKNRLLLKRRLTLWMKNLRTKKREKLENQISDR